MKKTIALLFGIVFVSGMIVGCSGTASMVSNNDNSNATEVTQPSVTEAETDISVSELEADVEEQVSDDGVYEMSNNPSDMTKLDIGKSFKIEKKITVNVGKPKSCTIKGAGDESDDKSYVGFKGISFKITVVNNSKNDFVFSTKNFHVYGDNQELTVTNPNVYEDDNIPSGQEKSKTLYVVGKYKNLKDIQVYFTYSMDGKYVVWDADLKALKNSQKVSASSSKTTSDSSSSSNGGYYYFATFSGVYQDFIDLCSSQYLTEYDLDDLYYTLWNQGLSNDEISFVFSSLRNAVYAVHGYIFDSDEFTRFFNQFSWYYPYTKDVYLSDIETANVTLIRDYQNAYGIMYNPD